MTAQLRARGIDLNETMVVNYGGASYVGPRAIEMLSLLSSDSEPADLHLGRREGRAIVNKKFGSEDEAVATSSGSNELSEEIYALPFKEAKQVIVDDFERMYFDRLLAKTDNNLSRASAEAGITRYYLRELLKRLGMHKSSKKKLDEP
jgi:DNA-binding NtrC family response regulator